MKCIPQIGLHDHVHRLLICKQLVAFVEIFDSLELSTIDIGHSPQVSRLYLEGPLVYSLKLL